MFSPFVNVLFRSNPPSSSTSYNCRHYPAGRIHGDHCSFPELLANIINNRSPSLSLHLCCLPPLPALKPWMHGGLRLLPIDRGGERGGWETEMEWVSALSPMRLGIAKKPAFMTITSRVGHKNTQTQTYLNPWGFTHKHIMTCHATEYIYSSATAHNTVSLFWFTFWFGIMLPLQLAEQGSVNWTTRISNCVDVNKIRIENELF